jgi:Icc protein
MYRIAQVSDLHIGPTADPVHGIDVRKQFVQVLEKLAEEAWDLLVLSGDLAADAGEIEAYQWLREVLQGFPCPYEVMMGNHDQLDTLRQVFALPAADIQDGMLYFSRPLGDKQLYFLDTASYVLPLRQVEWLRRHIESHSRDNLLFIHHPPVLCGCRFMDSQYPLRNIDEVWPLLRELPRLENIFCGHYHTAKTLSIDGKLIHVTPSTMMQIDAFSPRFAIQHTHPGWRVIEWNEDGLNTTARHLAT